MLGAATLGSDAVADASDARDRAMLEAHTARYVRGAASGSCQATTTQARRLLASIALHERFGASARGAISPAAAEGEWDRLLAELRVGIGIAGERPTCSSNPQDVSVTNGLAVLAFTRARYGRGWAQPFALIELVELGNFQPFHPRHSNRYTALLAIDVLTCEATGYKPICERAGSRMRDLYDVTIRSGPQEPTSPLYSAHTFEKHILMSQAVTDPVFAGQVGALLNLVNLWEAHAYLPGGGLGVLQSRDGPGGGARDRDSQFALQLAALLADPARPALAGDVRESAAVAIVASGYRLPDPIRSLYLDKRRGYIVTARFLRQVGAAASPFSVANFGHGLHAVWKAILGPQDAIFEIGAAYHHFQWAQYVASGIKVPCPRVTGRTCILYQHAPVRAGEVTDQGGVFVARTHDDPNDGRGELPDFERMVFHRSVLSIGDPTDRASRFDAKIAMNRTVGITKTFVPEWDDKAIGGTKHFPAVGAAGWRVGKVGNACIAWLPLQEGTLQEKAIPASGGFEYRYRMVDQTGKSAGIMVGSTPDEDCPNLAAFAADLAGRYAECSWNSVHGLPVCQFDARGADGALHRMRLEYLGDPAGSKGAGDERRYLCNTAPCPEIAGDWSGLELTLAEEMDRGLISSDLCAWNEASQTVACKLGGAPYVVDFAKFKGKTGGFPPSHAATPSLCTPAPTERLLLETARGVEARWTSFDIRNCGFGGSLTPILAPSVPWLSDCIRTPGADAVSCSTAGTANLAKGAYPFEIIATDANAPNRLIKRGTLRIR